MDSGFPVTGRMELETARLRLTAMDLDALQAWVDGDAGRLLTATGSVFDTPVSSPPLFGEDLPQFRDRMAETPQELGWWVWLVSRRHDAKPVGVCGLGGRPGRDGAVLLGYSVYPHLERLGYATEAAGAVVSWALSQPGVTRVRATVPTSNAGSVAVARKLGMTETGHELHPEVGDVTVYEVARRGVTPP